jgi:hypothetical protein
MTDRVSVTDLKTVDAFAMRVGHDALVHVSNAVPVWARDAAVQHLLEVVHSTTHHYATAYLDVGQSIRVALTPATRALSVWHRTDCEPSSAPRRQPVPSMS